MPISCWGHEIILCLLFFIYFKVLLVFACFCLFLCLFLLVIACFKGYVIYIIYIYTGTVQERLKIYGRILLLRTKKVLFLFYISLLLWKQFRLGILLSKAVKKIRPIYIYIYRPREIVCRNIPPPSPPGPRFFARQGNPAWR